MGDGIKAKQNTTKLTLAIEIQPFKKKINVTAVGKSKTLLNLQCSEKVNFDHFFCVWGGGFLTAFMDGQFCKSEAGQAVQEQCPSPPPAPGYGQL